MEDVNLLTGVMIAFFGLTAWYLNRAFINIDKKFDAVDKKFDAVDKKFDAVDKKFDDFKAEQNRRLDDFREFFKELLKSELRYIREDQSRIQLQLTNHVTQTDKRIRNIEDNQKIMQRDLSEIKDLLKNLSLERSPSDNSKSHQNPQK